ncbi:hypothetical protein NQ318_009522 [Aromia moschata]|uniref:DNA-directed DNA polymerase n=1 Tax=Aromia moschata TaxID=1265417 RepID=A0AAV8Z8H3_9CUCU|nr:hypothetical protein NQ318_009522 [Aromia moschata]
MFVASVKKPFLEGERGGLRIIIPNCIPIIFHNMSGYDFHMFIKELFSDKKNANVIVQSKEKYIFFAKYLHVDTYIDKKAYVTKKNTKLEHIFQMDHSLD